MEGGRRVEGSGGWKEDVEGSGGGRRVEGSGGGKEG